MKYDILTICLANYTIFNSSVDIEANLMKKQSDVPA